MEIRFPENCNDYLVFGFSEDEMGHLFDLTAVDYISFYKEFKNDKNIIIQAHPFRNGITAQNPEYLDGVETFNMHPNHNSRIGFDLKINGITIYSMIVFPYKDKKTGEDAWGISFPQRKGSDNKYYNEVYFFIDEKMRKGILEQIDILLGQN
jgi:hypothetical protein